MFCFISELILCLTVHKNGWGIVKQFNMAGCQCDHYCLSGNKMGVPYLLPAILLTFEKGNKEVSTKSNSKILLHLSMECSWWAMPASIVWFAFSVVHHQHFLVNTVQCTCRGYVSRPISLKFGHSVCLFKIVDKLESGSWK